MVFNLKKGFTIAELVVTIGIITILMSVSLFNYRSFNDRLALSAAGQEMALAIRQAQTYGINVKEAGVSSSQFASAYGIRFNFETNPYEYYIFVDKDKDFFYDVGDGCGGVNTECVEKVTIRNGVRIFSVSSTATCQATNSANYMQIMFLRPNPDALIRFYNNGGNDLVCTDQSDGIINLKSALGVDRQLIIQSTGQVYVE